jgi:hypothetical protein
MSTSQVAEVTWVREADLEYRVEIREGGVIITSADVTRQAMDYNGARAAFSLDKGIGGPRPLDAHVVAIREFDGAESLPATASFEIAEYTEPAPAPPAGVSVSVS